MNKIIQDITVNEYTTPTNKEGVVDIDTLVSRFKNRRKTCIILKGTKYVKEKTQIVYLIDKTENKSVLESVYRNGNKIKVAKKNNVKNSYFDFVTWDIMRVSNGQITGSNMNMLNDDEKYKCYIVDNNI